MNASQNHHTALSRVDRAVRTIKGMIANYYAEYDSADWEIEINTLIRTYNNTIHSSLYLKDYKGRKYSYTPEQVWENKSKTTLKSAETTCTMTTIFSQMI